MVRVVVTRIGQGKRLHIIDKSMIKTACGLGTDHGKQWESVSRKSNRICISCRVAEYNRTKRR